MKAMQRTGICAVLLAAGMLAACGSESSQTAVSSIAETTTSAAATDTTAARTAPETTTAAATTTTEAETGDSTDLTGTTTESTEPPIIPTANGYTNDDLITLARRYFGSRNNRVPAFIEVDGSDGDKIALHLYDVIEYHNVTSNWYYIDPKTAQGYDLYGDPVDLTEPEAELYNPEVSQRADFPEGARCGVQYIGTFPQGTGRANGYNAALIETFLMGGFADEYPFLGKLMKNETYAETTNAQELYLIIPKNPDARVIVTECDPVQGSVHGPVYSSYVGCPFLLYCNHSEIASDVLIQITDNSGVYEAFSVSLSGMDGKPVVSSDVAVVLDPELQTHYGD